MTTIRKALHTFLEPVLESYRHDPVSISERGDLAKEIGSIWSSLDLPTISPAQPALPKDASKEEVAERKKADRVRDGPIDLVRGVLEVVGRDIVMNPLLSGQLVQPGREASVEEKTRFQDELQYRLDVVLTLYEVAYTSYNEIQPLDAGGLFVPILEELVEVISIDTWRDLWSYIETRATRYTKGMLPSRGKALGLLRIFNTITRLLSRTPEDIAFKGRIWNFASRTIGITDRSAVNFRGEFNNYRTTWEETERGDVSMDTKDDAKEEYELYPTLWSLQEYFSYPPLLALKSRNRRPFDHFEEFKKKTEFVLPRLFEETEKEKESFLKEEGRAGLKRKRGESFFYPRYLTDKRLFDYELKDVSFRRQILTQYFILFQFLLNLTSESKAKQAYTGGMPKDFELKEDDSKWIRSKIQAIRGDFLKMPDEGQRFDGILLSIIGHEHFYATWKNEACSEAFFEIPAPEQPIFEDKVYTLPEQRLQPLNIKYYHPGNKPMPIPVTPYTIEEQGDDDSDDPEWKRMAKRIRKLKEEMEDDEAMGQLPADKKTAYIEKIEDLNFRALYLARRVVEAKYFELNTDKTSVLALDDTINAVESGERVDKGWTLADEVDEWYPIPEPSAVEKKEDEMEVEPAKEIADEVKGDETKDEAKDEAKDDAEDVPEEVGEGAGDAAKEEQDDEVAEQAKPDEIDLEDAKTSNEEVEEAGVNAGEGDDTNPKEEEEASISNYGTPHELGDAEGGGPVGEDEAQEIEEPAADVAAEPEVQVENLDEEMAQ